MGSESLSQCIQQSHKHCPNTRYSNGQNLVWQALHFWPQCSVAECWGVARCGQTKLFPGDPVHEQGHLGTPHLRAKASSQQHSHHRRKKTEHVAGVSPSKLSTVMPTHSFSCWVSQTPSTIPCSLFMWHSLRHSMKISAPGGNSMISKKHPKYPRQQYKSVDYTHSAKPALLLETSCQFSTGTGILVSMKLSWCWRAPRGLLSMRRMGLFWIVSTRSRWENKKTTKKQKNRRTKNNRHGATKC